MNPFIDGNSALLIAQQVGRMGLIKNLLLERAIANNMALARLTACSPEPFPFTGPIYTAQTVSLPNASVYPSGPEDDFPEACGAGPSENLMGATLKTRFPESDRNVLDVQVWSDRGRSLDSGCSHRRPSG